MLKIQRETTTKCRAELGREDIIGLSREIPSAATVYILTPSGLRVMINRETPLIIEWETRT